jgi:hypothetical protein
MDFLLMSLAFLLIATTCVVVVGGLGYGLVQFVRFWIGFANGINEANPKPRGFEVKPVPKERD